MNTSNKLFPKGILYMEAGKDNKIECKSQDTLFQSKKVRIVPQLLNSWKD